MTCFTQWPRRRRWDHLLATLGVPKSLAITPRSLRGGGACYLYHRSTPITDILWRMRLRQVATLEFNLQEAAAMNTMQHVPHHVQQRAKSCAAMLMHVSSPLDLLDSTLCQCPRLRSSSPFLLLMASGSDGCSHTLFLEQCCILLFQMWLLLTICLVCHRSSHQIQLPEPLEREGR